MDLISSQQRQAAAQTLQVRQALSTIIEQAQWLGSSSALGKPCAPRWRRCRRCPSRNSWTATWPSCACSACSLKTSWKTVAARIQTRRRQRADQPGAAHRRCPASHPARAAELAAVRLRHPNPRADQAEGGQHPADRSVERNSRCHPPLSVLGAGRQSDQLLLPAQRGARSDARPVAGHAVAARRCFHDDGDQPRNVDPDLRRPAAGDFQHQFAQALSRLPRARQQPRRQGDAGRILPDGAHRFWSILVAMPLPVLWAALGYGLQSAWNYPVAEAIGKG